MPEQRGEAHVRLALIRAPAIAADPRLPRLRPRLDAWASRAPARGAAWPRCSLASRRARTRAPDSTPARSPEVASGTTSSPRGDRRFSASARTSASRRVVVAEVGPQNSAPGHEQRGVHGGELHRLEAASGLGVEEVIEEAAVAGGVRRRVLRRLQKKRSVRRTRSAACARVIQPRSAPIGYAVRANPTRAHAHERRGRRAVGREPGEPSRSGPRNSGSFAPTGCRGTRSAGADSGSCAAPPSGASRARRRAAPVTAQPTPLAGSRLDLPRGGGRRPRDASSQRVRAAARGRRHRAARGPHHQRGRQSPRGAADSARGSRQQLHRALPERQHVDVHGGERRREVARHRDVVETDHRHVLGHADCASWSAPSTPDRHVIVGHEHRGAAAGICRTSRAHRLVAGAFGELSLEPRARVRPEPGVAQRRAVALEALARVDVVCGPMMVAMRR